VQFVVNYLEWRELNRWYFISRMRGEGSREAVSKFRP
jgi:hypothetical protein